MIDEDRTIQLFGYTSSDLSAGSGKQVVDICEECGKYRVLHWGVYNKEKDDDLCHACAMGTDKKRKMMRLYGINRRHTEEELIKMSVSQLGEKNHNWKGGITPWRSKMWFSPIYKQWRASVFERDDYTCQMCNERGGYLESHHILPVRDNKNTLLIIDVDNGITLCKKCHNKTKGKEYEFVEHFEDIIRGKQP